MRRFVGSATPILISEWGFDLATTTNQPAACKYPVAATTSQGCEQNISSLMTSMIEGLNAHPDLNISHVFWYNYADQTATIQAGLIDQGGRKRSSYYTFQAAASRLGLASQQQIRANHLAGLILTGIKLVQAKLA